MTRRHHYHDFPSATGDPVYRVSFDCHSAAERDAVRAAGLAASVQEVTPPEPDPVVYPPNCEGNAQFGYEPAQSGQAVEILIELTEGDE